MVDIYVLDGNLQPIGIIDYYSSLIWAKRYVEDGDCELYVKATDESLNLLRTGRYLTRLDDDMVCQIKNLELNTDQENGNYITVTGYDVKSLLNQRVIWGQSNVDGNVESYIREIVTQTLSNPSLSARQIKTESGRANFLLAAANGFTEVTTEQVSYKNVGEKVKELCTVYGWGYRVYVNNENFYFDLYKGTDRSDSVIFSNDYENLLSSNYKENSSNIANVALIGGEGEGSDRTRNVSGYAESVERYEIFVDAKDISKTITWADLIAMYPTTEQGGQGSIQTVTNPDETIYYVYQMNYIDISIVDDNQLTELRAAYPGGTEITIDGNLYYRVYNVAIADLPSNSLTDNDDVILRDIVYSVYLLNRGYEKLAEYGTVTSFDGTIEPNTTFKYKEDYFLGDIVSVENEYKISADARIVEVVEVFDDNGHSVEPKFEYLGGI